MRILFAAMEMTPYVKIGGVGDVIYHWARSLAIRGHEVSVVLPAVDKNITAVPEWLDLNVLQLEGFSPSAPYEFEEDFDGTHAERLHRLAESIINLCRIRAIQGRPFDILHVNEWPVAIIPYLLKNVRQDFTPPGTVITVHCMMYGGIMPARAFGVFGADPFVNPCIVDNCGMVHLLAAGIMSADIVTAPSVKYANEIATDINLQKIFGQKIYEKFGSVARRIRGILHGIDYEVWNPSTDPVIACNFDSSKMSGKAICKVALETQFGLSGKHSSPVILFAGRLCAEKGIDIFVQIIPHLCTKGVRVIIAGSGEREYVDMVKQVILLQPEGLARYIGWADTETMHRLYAGSDIFVMPSRHEACGLAHMEAQRYGTVPVVRKCGGLAETVIDHMTDAVNSTGFTIMEADAVELERTLDSVLDVINTEEFHALKVRCMNAPPEWKTVTVEYERLYNIAVSGSKELYL
jgi:starch synthase